jgi:hypothetical protein
VALFEIISCKSIIIPRLLALCKVAPAVRKPKRQSKKPTKTAGLSVRLASGKTLKYASPNVK